MYVGINSLTILFFTYFKYDELLAKEFLLKYPDIKTIIGTSKFLISKSHIGIET